jgi:hypothetical protein
MSSHIDHHAAIEARGSGALAHISGPSEDLYEHVVSQAPDGRRYNFPVTQSGGLNASMHTSFFSPASALPTIAPAASQVDLRIPAGSCGAVTSLAVRLDLENKSAGASTFAGIPTLLERIEIWGESGSQLIQRWTSDALRLLTHYLTKEQSEVYSNNEGTLYLGPGVSRSFYLRLPFSFFESSHLNVASLTSDLYVRLFFRGADSYDTTDYLSLNGCQAVVSWIAYPPSIQRALTARAKSSTLDYRYWAFQTQREVINLASNQRYSIRLTSMQGIVNQIALIIRPVGSTGSALASGYVRPVSYELVDSGGKSVLGASSFPIEWNDFEKQQQNLLPPSGTFGSIYGTLLIPLGINVKGSLMSGSIQGFYVSGGYDQLAFTTDNATAGDHEITVVWSIAERLRKDGGKLSVHTS